MQATAFRGSRRELPDVRDRLEDGRWCGTAGHPAQRPIRRYCHTANGAKTMMMATQLNSA
ncbi:hypothetical protein GCM10009596_02090 [Arthrobacter rhombi]